MVYALAEAGETNRAREPERVRNIIDRALVQCYALEGSYPVDLEHLVHYGVIIDTDRYVFAYELFAINIKPTVTVVLRN
jgi:hypothetical protein